MPCIDGVPQEFAMQDAFALATKARFPGTRMLLYRITDAVPYDAVVHDAMVEHPEWFVRWTHAPNNNGSICVVPPEAQTGRPGDNCSWPIQAAAYDWNNSLVRDFFLEKVVKPVMKAGDGVWLDGDGPDNGAYQCSGSYDFGKLPAPYPALDEPEIDAFCVGENLVQEAVHNFLFANGGMDGQACWTFVGVDELPQAADAPAACAAKLLRLDALVGKNNTPVGVAMDRCGGGVSDDIAKQAVASFMLVRDKYWFFGTGGDSLNDTTAGYMLSDFGWPLGDMTNASALLFERKYKHATVSLDCASYTASFTPVA